MKEELRTLVTKTGNKISIVVNTMYILKEEFFHVHDMKAYRRCRGIAPLILSFGTTRRRVTPRTCLFTLRKELLYPFNGRYIGFQGGLYLVKWRKISLNSRDSNAGSSIL
jgi:hypothetical protein